MSSLAHAELNINRVITSVEGSGKWITVRTIFYNVDSDNVTEIFRMGIDGDLENGNFHALRFDERSFRIPKEYSFESQPGRFFFADFSVNSGAFRNLYNYLDTKNQVNIEAACNYMNNSKVIDEILKTKSSNNAHGPFLANQKTKKSLSYLLDLCVKTSAKVYVVDVQNYLSALGYNVGKIDGKWGRKSELGLAKFQTDRGLEVKTAVSSNLLRMMKADVIDKEIKFSTLSTKPQYFDAKGKLIGKPKKRLTITQKLNNQKTINAFKAWHTKGKPQKSYGLMWDGGRITSEPDKTITLFEVYWAYNYSGKSWSYYKGIEKYLSKRTWKHSAEYGKTLATKIIDPSFQDFIVDVMVQEQKINSTDGIMLDWWHDNHPSGYSKHQVRMARTAIAKKLRAKIGPDKIILGNVNWGKDTATVPYINGVFLELYKKPSKSTSNRLYGSQELRNMESLLDYYEQNLQAPKLIALNGWRKTKSVTDKDRNTPENRKMAKLLTAMSVVIPTNGYILYGDNNNDTPDGDHAHLFYDFYSFDIGKPTSGYNKVRSGVGYKEHDRGFIAYNITGSSKKFKRKNGQEHTIEAKSGLFCKDVGAKTECLTNN
ncbi:peptidoglycan-binding protein [Amylibacter sp.]|nr:peptidoglycan-binding protein [Amylibacter sp.]